MKEGWEYKRFEDALEKVKYTKKLQTNEFLSEGRVPIISQEEDYISGFWNNPDDAYKVEKPIVIFGDHSRVIKYVDFDFVLGADGVKILKPIESLNAKFLYHYLKWYNVPNMGYSRHYKFLKEINMPVPPLKEQQQIVSELDLLSGIVEKHKAQLEELDKLAQSIFYDMFGDPVKNEKGWETVQLEELCTKITDGTHDTPQRLKEGIKFITGKHIRPFYIDYNNSDFVTEEVHRIIYARCNPEYGDVLYTNIGAGVGNAALNIVNYEFSMKNVALLKLKNSYIKGIYLIYYLNNEKVKNSIIDRFTNGGAQIFLSLKSIGRIEVNLPPLALQQEFATKVEAIEAMKAKVRQSLKEAETLFNERMDYYFN